MRMTWTPIAGWLSVLAGGALIPAFAQQPPEEVRQMSVRQVVLDRQLRGLTGVAVIFLWNGATPADNQAIEAEIELRLRRAGMHVLEPAEYDPDKTPGMPTLYISVTGTGLAIPISVEMQEQVFSMRGLSERERREHSPSVGARSGENPNEGELLIFWATTWERHGVAQNAPNESVKDIIDRYRKEWAAVGISGAAQHMMDLEVQAAMANAQHPAGLGTVRDTVKGYVDEFVNAWLTVNPRQR